MDAAPHDVEQLAAIHHDFIDREAQPVALEAYAAGRVGLRVGIQQQRALLRGGERRGEVDGGSGLSDATFLIGDSDDAAGHGGGEMYKQARGRDRALHVQP